MNYGGTDAAYAGMEDRNEGDSGDRANAVDRDDMDQPTGRTGALSGGGMTGGTEDGDGTESSAGSGLSDDGVGGTTPSTSGGSGTLSGGHSGGA
jgi:hypothetical protein